MSSKREDVPTAGTKDNINLNFTHAELENAWLELYSTLPPLLGEGERTPAMIAKDLDVEHSTALKIITQWIETGRIVSVGIRRSKTGKNTEAYRVIK